MTKKELLNGVTYKLIEDQKIFALAEKIPHKTINGYLVTYSYRSSAMENFSVIVGYDNLKDLKITEAELNEAARKNTDSSITKFIDMVIRLEWLDRISKMNHAEQYAA